jgi:cell wall assembly regulator SMI1
VWRQMISGWTDAATFTDPASEAAIRKCEEALGQKLPDDLASLLRESNGVLGEDDVDLVWSVERIIDDNLMFRTDPDFATLYMPFEPLLFFADAGDGNQFAFVMRDRPADVFAWEHETDSRTMIAPSLASYLESAATVPDVRSASSTKSQ